MSAEYKFNFFRGSARQGRIQLQRSEQDDFRENPFFYQKPSLVDQPSRALPFKTFKHADECAKSWERIGYKSKVLKFEAKLQEGT